MLHVTDYLEGKWSSGENSAVRSRDYCCKLEGGEILFFPRLPFPLNEADVEFLVSRSYSGSKFHKNLSYRPASDALRGYRGSRSAETRVRAILKDYSRQATAFATAFLKPYAGQLKLDLASFRALEEQGRALPLHKRNDLLHIDAFPTRPTSGARILRVFTNINPGKSRVWVTGAQFSSLAKNYADTAGLRRIASGKKPFVSRLLRSVGGQFTPRSAYDEFMLRFHDFLKENTEVQSRTNERIEFPPMSTWIVYTDGVSHAALAGQFALEQTFFVPLEALVSPDDAPIRVLERLCRRPLAA